MNEQLPDIISGAILDTLKKLISYDISFSFVLENHNNWSEEFPERLKNQKQIILNIKDQSLEDSYLDKNDAIIVIEIDGVTYSKKVDESDIMAIMVNEKSPPFILRQFSIAPKTPVPKRRASLLTDKEGLVHSMNNFKKFNPEMFDE